MLQYKKQKKEILAEQASIRSRKIDESTDLHLFGSPSKHQAPKESRQEAHEKIFGSKIDTYKILKQEMIKSKTTIATQKDLNKKATHMKRNQTQLTLEFPVE